MSEDQEPEELTDTDAQPASDLVCADNSRNILGVPIHDRDAPQSADSTPGTSSISIVELRLGEASWKSDAVDDLAGAGHPMDDGSQWVEARILGLEEGVQPATENSTDPLRVLGGVLFCRSCELRVWWVEIHVQLAKKRRKRLHESIR